MTSPTMVEIVVDIEIYCDTCGAGLCLEARGTAGKTRGEPQYRVNACPTCIARKDDEIADLQEQIEDLTYLNEQLEESNKHNPLL